VSYCCLGDRVAFVGFLVAFEVEFGIGEQGRVARQLSFGLGHRRLVRGGINLHQRTANLDVLSFLVVHLHKLPRDACSHRNGVQRRDNSERVDIHADVAGPRRGGADHQGIRAAAESAAASLRQRLTMGVKGDEAENKNDSRQKSWPTTPAFERFGILWFVG